MWASSLAINGLLGYGKEASWSVHTIEHELSAFYDVTHGAGLAVLTPVWMEYALNADTVDKFAQYGVNVWGLGPGARTPSRRAAIEKTGVFTRRSASRGRRIGDRGRDVYRDGRARRCQEDHQGIQAA